MYKILTIIFVLTTFISFGQDKKDYELEGTYMADVSIWFTDSLVLITDMCEENKEFFFKLYDAKNTTLLKTGTVKNKFNDTYKFRSFKLPRYEMKVCKLNPEEMTIVILDNKKDKKEGTFIFSFLNNKLTKTEGNISSYIECYEGKINGNSKRVRNLLLVKEEYRQGVYLLSEKNTYTNAKSIADYKTYINKFPKGKYVTECEAKIEELSYQEAVKINTENSLQNYLLHYPNGKYSAVVKKQQNELAKNEIVFYNNAMKGTLKDCEQYLSQYPSGQYSSTVLARKEKLKIEDNLYNVALKGNLNDCDKYISIYPQGYYLSEIQNRKRQLLHEQLIESFNPLVQDLKNAMGEGIDIRIFIGSDGKPKCFHIRKFFSNTFAESTIEPEFVSKIYYENEGTYNSISVKQSNNQSIRWIYYQKGNENQILRKMWALIDAINLTNKITTSNNPYKNESANESSSGLYNVIRLLALINKSSSNNSDKEKQDKVSYKILEIYEIEVCNGYKVKIHNVENPKYPDDKNIGSKIFYWSGVDKCVGDNVGWYHFDTGLLLDHIYQYYGKTFEEACKRCFGD